MSGLWLGLGLYIEVLCYVILAPAYRATRLGRDFDNSHENLYLCLIMCVTINHSINDILATKMG